MRKVLKPSMLATRSMALAAATCGLFAVQSAFAPASDARGIADCRRSEISKKTRPYDVSVRYARAIENREPGNQFSSAFNATWSFEAVELRIRRCRGLVKVVLAGGRSDVGTASYSGSALNGDAEATSCDWSFNLAPIGVVTLRGLLDKRKRSRSQGLTGEVRNRFVDLGRAFSREFDRQTAGGCLTARGGPGAYYEGGSLGGRLGTFGSYLTFGPALPALQFRLPIGGSKGAAAHRRRRAIGNPAIRKMLRGKRVALESTTPEDSPENPEGSTRRYSAIVELRPPNRTRRPSTRLSANEAQLATKQRGCAFAGIAGDRCAAEESVVVDNCQRRGHRRVVCRVTVTSDQPGQDEAPAAASCSANAEAFKASDGQITVPEPAWTCAVP